MSMSTIGDIYSDTGDPKARNTGATLFECACFNPIHSRPIKFVMVLGGTHDQAECPECEEAKFTKFATGPIGYNAYADNPIS